MGTMGAWEGSKGKWREIRELSEKELERKNPKIPPDLLDALSDGLGALADAPTGDTGQPGDAPAGVTPAAPSLFASPLPAGRTWSRSSAARGRGGGGGGGGEGGGRSGGGRRRSQAYAAGVGGNVLAAALAYRNGDSQTLEALGLDLDELASLSGLKRINSILNALVGADGGIEDAELRRVNARVLREVFTNGLDGVACVRLYIVEYTVQVWAAETGKMQRASAASGQKARDLERQLRDALRTKAGQVEVAAASTAQALRDAIASSLTLMRRLMKGL
jgi:hypothetical protein